MVRYPVLAIAILALPVCGCSRTAPPAPDPAATRTVQTGVASFYGREFAGRKTASGDRLRLDAMTAASRTLPLGARVQVVNEETGKSARVTINDRGPYADGRVLDVTPKAARRIGLDKEDGLAKVSIRSLPPTEATAP